MRKIFKRENTVLDKNFFSASVIVVVIFLSLLLRLWFLQIFRGAYYRQLSENNRIRKIETPAPRGLVFDAYGQLILGNSPSADLVYIPQYGIDKDKTLLLLSKLFYIPVRNLEKKIRVAADQPKFLPVTLVRNLNVHDIALVQSNKLFLPGVEIRITPRRDYNSNVPAHLLGYLGEVSPKQIETLNKRRPDNPYVPGDLIGKQGLEARWESYLRGKRGFRFIQVDAHGLETHLFQFDKWKLPEVAAVQGANLELTIDFDLQKTVREAFGGKNGAVVVLNPKNGAVLALLSQPTYDLNAYQKGLSAEEWKTLTHDPFHPFLDKTTGGEFPPGSVYKAVVALAGLQEKVITPQTTYFCPGYFTLGGQTFKCYQHSGHGPVNVVRALMKSCDTFFYHVGVELGVDRLAKYAKAFGLGRMTGLDVNMERPGLIPTVSWKKFTYKENWAAGETPPVAIGQGYNLVTPIQMALLYMALGNQGKIWKPFVVKRINHPMGKILYERQPLLQKEVTEIASEHFKIVQEGLEAVVMNDEGSGRKARVSGVRVAGKTGSVQVVNLAKNQNHSSNVSIKWKEHAMFASYAPANDPEIVVAVVSEHDAIGGGGVSAAPVAGKILTRYFELKSQREKLMISSQQQSKAYEEQRVQ